MKTSLGFFEAVFDVCYLLIASVLGVTMLLTARGDESRMLAGCMALVLAAGDAFHLTPRIRSILHQDAERFRAALGRGKQITSISMTLYYLLLWTLGQRLLSQSSTFWNVCVYLLVVARVALCLLPQNRWQERQPPHKWELLRNLPFALLGAVTAGWYFINRAALAGMRNMWLAIVLSFAFYLPVVFFAQRRPKLGMLMLPKTCAYVWMLCLCLTL